MDRVEKAQKALEEAQKEVGLAKAEELGRKAEKALRDSNRALWELCRHLEWPSGHSELYQEHENLQDHFSVLVFQADERVKKLSRLDPERWCLEGEFKPSLQGFTTDEDMAYSIATWLFDCSIEKNPIDGEYQRLRKKAIESVGEDITHQGFKFYLEGRHDT